MKNLINASILILSVLLIIITILFSKQKNEIRKSALSNSQLQDSINKYKSSSGYLANMWRELKRNHNFRMRNVSKVYKLENSQRNLIDFDSLARNNKLLVIRYTQIGCNACVDSTFKLIKKYKNLENYKVITLVDFDEVDYYLKWRKISEFDGDVYWLKKGDIPYPVESSNNSYMFTLNHNLKAESLFIPNSTQVSYLKEYLNNL